MGEGNHLKEESEAAGHEQLALLLLGAHGTGGGGGAAHLTPLGKQREPRTSKFPTLSPARPQPISCRYPALRSILALSPL